MQALLGGRLPWALLLYAGVTFYALSMVPSWEGITRDPCLWAAIGALNTLLCLIIIRWLPSSSQWLEPLTVALFLAGMPLVYVARYVLFSQDLGRDVLAVEVLGLALFVPLAGLGFRRWPWLLVLGIAGHGLAWDLWHLHGYAHIPHWYARACLYLDLALALYCALRIPDWRRTHYTPVAA